ncbi:permease [Ornithinibacillus sp. 179-J 7C1 HS]|uniref:permease n=1 Tax=Ornithinibacillus sp. 179-J 7C1 HS TaxID=3142384 RepID=UPI0039A3A37E
MAFIISYLYPQFKENDERSKQIKQKGMYYTIFIILLTLIALNLLIQFDILEFSVLEVVRILISLVIVTFWTTWLILSKRM